MKYKKAKDVVILWEFANEYWEQYVIFFATKPWFWKDYPVLFITGDEMDWECVELYLIWAREWIRVFATNKWFTGKFLFTKEEQEEIVWIVKDFNSDIIDWLMKPTESGKMHLN